MVVLSAAEVGGSAPAKNANLASSENVFASLFSKDGEKHRKSSIFSDKNPFKRKHSESTTGLLDSNMPESEKQFGVSDPKRQRKKEKVPSSNVVDDSVIDRQTETAEVQSTEGKKRKRKRDEIEKDYNLKKTGKLPDEVECPAVGKKRKAADGGINVAVSKERDGFDDESKLLRTVFVGNVPLNIKKKAIVKEFKRFGEIESVRIRSVPIVDTKAPRKAAIIRKKFNEAAGSVNAYIVFKSEESAVASLAYNMTLLWENHIRVDRACPPRKKPKGGHTSLYDNKRSIFMGNLPFDVKDEEVYQLFSNPENYKYQVEAVRVVRDPRTSLGKGIAYVLFKTKEDADMALMRGSFTLGDRELRLSRARRDATPSKRTSVTPLAGPAKKSAPRFSTGNDFFYQGLRGKRGQGGRYEGSRKRPAVAARKARQVGSGAGFPAKSGNKRKFDSYMPVNSSRKKKHFK